MRGLIGPDCRFIPIVMYPERYLLAAVALILIIGVSAAVMILTCPNPQ